MNTITLELNSTAKKVAAAGFCFVLAALVLYFPARWAFGHAVAVNAANEEVAKFGADLAPNDPHARVGLARLLERTFLPRDQQEAFTAFEAAAALSPHDYTMWLALARAKEQASDADGAEHALRRAQELAPNYARVQWALGNVLLRQGRQDDGFAEIRKAAASDASFAGPAASAAWQILGGDVDRVRAAIGDSRRINASLALLLANDKRYGEAAEFWRRAGVSGDDEELKETAANLFNRLIDGGRYRSAMEVARSAGSPAAVGAAEGAITNGGFESTLAAPKPAPFAWTVAEGPFPAVGLNEGQKHGGNYSLLIRFGQGGKGFRQVSQKVAVEPARAYDLRFFYRSELTTTARVRCDVVAAATGEVLAGAVLASKQDWTEVVQPFTVPANVEGVEIRISMDNCPEAGCGGSGNLWFDDFALTGG